jgi:dTDP-glucose 4,6-dehydratase/UDP-glucose 4,6-dehydratase
MEYSIMEVSKILIKAIHNTEDYDKWISYIKDRPFNDKRYYISNQKLKNLGWKITMKFDEGIKQLINI